MQINAAIDAQRLEDSKRGLNKIDNVARHGYSEGLLKIRHKGIRKIKNRK